MILHIYFKCEPPVEDLVECFREAATLLLRKKEPLLFQEERISRLPDKSGLDRAREVIWTAPGARLRLRISTGKGDPRAGFVYDIAFFLDLDSGHRLELQSESTTDTSPQEVLLRFSGATPDQFSAIRDIFRRRFGTEADQTDSVWITTVNVEAALKSGYGAFARSLLDRGKTLYPTIADVSPDLQEYWWPRFRELTRKMEDTRRLDKDGPPPEGENI